MFLSLLFSSSLLIASSSPPTIISNGWEVLNDTTVLNQVVFDNGDTMEMTSHCSKGNAWLAGEKVDLSYNWMTAQKRYFEEGTSPSKIVVKSKVTKDTREKVLPLHKKISIFDIIILTVFFLMFLIFSYVIIIGMLPKP